MRGIVARIPCRCRLIIKCWFSLTEINLHQSVRLVLYRVNITYNAVQPVNDIDISTILCQHPESTNKL